MTLLYLAAGESSLYLNGEKVSQNAVEGWEMVERYIPQRMEGIPAYKLEGLRLKAGKNTLLVSLRPSDKAEWRPWFFGGIVLDPQGELITDLSYSVEE